MLTPGDADFSTGPIRYSFLVVAQDGRLISKPTADVWIARGFKERPYQRSTARLESVGVPGRSTASGEPLAIYVTHLRADRPGTYWVLAKPKGTKISGLGNIVVRRHSYAKAVGERAPHSNTPTLATAHGRLSQLSTSTRPDRQLYTTSVAAALDAHQPFVVVFATPKFCTSRLCGPTVQIVQDVQSRMKDTPMRFIHLEIYQGNDANNPPNSWVTEWGLPTEPWVFVVGADGNVKAKFEGALSIAELEKAARAALS